MENFSKDVMSFEMEEFHVEGELHFQERDCNRILLYSWLTSDRTRVSKPWIFRKKNNSHKILLKQSLNILKEQK